MHHATPLRPDACAPFTLPRLLAGLLLCGALLLPAALPAGAVPLNWADPGVIWPNGSLGPHSFTLSNGIIVTITVTQPVGTTGVFTFSTPAEDCPSGCVNGHLFGTLHNLGIVFDPNPGTPPVSSPILVTVSYSAPVTDLTFEISDIDFSQAGAGQDHRLDQVSITSNVGNPTLTFKTAAPRTFSIAGNTATANCTGVQPTCSPSDTTAAVPVAGNNPNPDSGTVIVDFSALAPVSTVTITYTEAGNGANPSGRGVGFLANQNLTPVELMGFSVD